MPRKKIVAGNWKMYTTVAAARDLAATVAAGVGPSGASAEVVVCPPFVWLNAVADALRGSVVDLGAQNLYPAAEGAFTGEVSPGMLLEAGCRYCIVGHSERRHGLGETDEFVNAKVKAGLAAGLHIILCVGETIAEREAGRTFEVLDRHVEEGLKGVAAEKLADLVIAYEPVWAIGTGKVATPEQAQEAHAHIREKFGALYGADHAGGLIIQYGGSVKPDNAKVLMGLPDVDGALVGGASLKAESFLEIVRAAG